MKIFQINTVYASGSTGKIALGIHDVCQKNGVQCKTAYSFPEGKQYPDSFPATSWLDCHVHNRIARRTTLQGCFSYLHTKRLIEEIKAYAPDIIHLHNLHGSYLNHPLLFSFLKQAGIPVVWTLHDCWAFTGFCPFFDYAKCGKWKTGCCACPQNQRPDSRVDCTAFMYQQKKKWFTGVPNLTIVTPSAWLKDLVQESFLREYPVQVIPNGIDLNVFKPTPQGYDLQERYGRKPILLGVAGVWERRKGLNVFQQMAKDFQDRYQLILVGTDESTEKLLPDSVLCISRTENQQELAALYASAAVFANPTYEDNYPTVNMEAIACGTPVVTFATGGSPESIGPGCGTVVPQGDISAFESAVEKYASAPGMSRTACLEYADIFDQNLCFRKYLDLYRSLSGRKG